MHLELAKKFHFFRMGNDRPLIICLTPVRNESWILDTFLSCTSLWADYIIIADQKSTDNSREIALKYPKVILIENNTDHFNEPERQKLLINEARKIDGKRLLITLDADEFFVSNFQEKKEWNEILSATPGTVFGFRWINLLPGYKKYWSPEGYFPWAFMDDGSQHFGQEIHSPRVPLKSWDTIKKITEIRVLHYQYIDWLRMQSKHRYYQILERIKFPAKSAVQIYRMYHHMNAVKNQNLSDSDEHFFSFYEDNKIAIRQVVLEKKVWFDDTVMCLIAEHGKNTFHKEDVWFGRFQNLDSRNWIDKLIHFWLRFSNKHTQYSFIKKIDKILAKWY